MTRYPRQSADLVSVWRLRCTFLDEQLEDVSEALRVSEALSKDYRHVLGQLWRANAGMVTRRERS